MGTKELLILVEKGIARVGRWELMPYTLKLNRGHTFLTEMAEQTPKDGSGLGGLNCLAERLPHANQLTCSATQLLCIQSRRQPVQSSTVRLKGLLLNRVSLPCRHGLKVFN